MKKIDRFFRGMALICLGIIIGFLVSPIKKGIRVTIGSYNSDSELMNEYGTLDDDDFEMLEEDDFDDEPDFETPDEEEIPF